MVDVDKVLDDAGLSNEAVRDYVKHWAEHLQPDRIEVVSAADDSRLIEEALAAGEIQPAGEGLYYSRSYSKDTAPSSRPPARRTRASTTTGATPTRSGRSSRAT